MQDNANPANLRIKGFRVVGLMDGRDFTMINANNGNRTINRFEMPRLRTLRFDGLVGTAKDVRNNGMACCTGRPGVYFSITQKHKEQ